MKLLRNTIAIILSITFLNVIVSKSLHEFFEHDHVEHTCDVKDITHFHEFEFAHADFICDYNISANFIVKHQFFVENLLRYAEQQVQVKFIWLAKNIYLDSHLLRGPPSFK